MVRRFLRRLSSEILFAELFIGSLVVLGLVLAVLNALLWMND